MTKTEDYVPYLNFLLSLFFLAINLTEIKMQTSRYLVKYKDSIVSPYLTVYVVLTDLELFLIPLIMH